MSPVVLDIKNVTVQFGGVVAIDNASLIVKRGDLIGFVGPNGAGKTTMMRVIMGMVKPQHGSIHLSGKDLKNMRTEHRIRSGLALAEQIVKPLRKLSLLENVTFACGHQNTKTPWQSLKNMTYGREKQHAAALLKWVGLEKYKHRMPDTVPLGVLKRLEMARALALSPQMLLLDEPLAGLNQAEAREIANLIQDINKTSMTILLIEHNLREVMRICPYIYVQDQGKSLAFGDTKQIMQRPDVLQAYLGK